MSSSPLQDATRGIIDWGTRTGHTGAARPRATEIFGSLTFSDDVQRRRLPRDAYRALRRTVTQGAPLDASVADVIATTMKDWAIEHGATHYTHWFHPLTGITAEKHDSFIVPSAEGRAVAEFGGKELIKGEPDASSFPSGGMRSTFEARGYTAWDPTSPPWLLVGRNGTTLVIPSAFLSWTGHSLDTKTPLLRSIEALSKQATRILRLFGSTSERVHTTCGPEQEYFLIDRYFYFARPDLINTGRTLFGAKPPKGQELEDQYFGVIPERVLAYMSEVEFELSKLGVPIKTRHNEVAPSQYEVAPIFENSNLATDHQNLIMQTLRSVAEKYGLACLLHEKPFAGINGSGKHNNWSMSTDEGENLLNPGDTPHENLQFLFFCTAVIQAVNKHQGLLRASIASPGQDHRLGANEAPPAIISIFLGAELETLFEAIESGAAGESTPESFLGLGTPVLPPLPLHGGDRNRTSPFAFTGNKFEFRALGSSQSLGLPNTVLNTIVAEAIDYLSEELEDGLNQGKSLEDALRPIMQRSYSENKQIVFGGDGYSEQWHEEAERRGLLNLPATPDALPYLISDDTVTAFSNYGVLSERELHARYEVFLEQYITKLNIEAETAASIARTMLLPSAARYKAELLAAGEPELASEIGELVSSFLDTIRTLESANLKENTPEDTLEEHARYMHDVVFAAMGGVRDVADQLEKMVADDLWPLPKYSEILFIK